MGKVGSAQQVQVQYKYNCNVFHDIQLYADCLQPMCIVRTRAT